MTMTKTEPRLLKTPYRRELERRNTAIFRDYEELMSVEGQSKREVLKVLAKKYAFHAENSVRYIIDKKEAEKYGKEDKS